MSWTIDQIFVMVTGTVLLFGFGLIVSGELRRKRGQTFEEKHNLSNYGSYLLAKWYADNVEKLPPGTENRMLWNDVRDHFHAFVQENARETVTVWGDTLSAYLVVRGHKIIRVNCETLLYDLKLRDFG